MRSPAPRICPADGRRQDLASARRSPLFAGVAPPVVERLLSAAAVHQLPRGATLIEQGDEALSVLHILVSGSVGLRACTEDGSTTLLGIMRPGDVFLLSPVLLGTAAEVSAETLTAARVLVVPVAEFRRLLAAEPSLSTAALRLMASHCRALAEQLVDVKLRGAEERVARFLRRRASAASGQPGGEGVVDMPEPKAAVALRLGMTPESLSRTLGALERRGVIRNRDGRLIVAREQAVPALRLVA